MRKVLHNPVGGTARQNVHLALYEVLAHVGLLRRHNLREAARCVPRSQDLGLRRVLANSLLKLVFSDEVDEFVPEIGELDRFVTA